MVWKQQCPACSLIVQIHNTWPGQWDPLNLQSLIPRSSQSTFLKTLYFSCFTPPHLSLLIKMSIIMLTNSQRWMVGRFSSHMVKIAIIFSDRFRDNKIECYVVIILIIPVSRKPLSLRIRDWTVVLWYSFPIWTGKTYLDHFPKEILGKYSLNILGKLSEYKLNIGIWHSHCIII